MMTKLLTGAVTLRENCTFKSLQFKSNEGQMLHRPVVLNPFFCSAKETNGLKLSQVLGYLGSLCMGTWRLTFFMQSEGLIRNVLNTIFLPAALQIAGHSLNKVNLRHTILQQFTWTGCTDTCSPVKRSLRKGAICNILGTGMIREKTDQYQL